MRLFCFVFVLQLLIIFVPATTFTVGPGGTHATVQAAIDAAVDAGGDNEIRITQGIYFQTAKLEGDQRWTPSVGPLGGISKVDSAVVVAASKGNSERGRA